MQEKCGPSQCTKHLAMRCNFDWMALSLAAHLTHLLYNSQSCKQSERIEESAPMVEGALVARAYLQRSTAVERLTHIRLGSTRC